MKIRVGVISPTRADLEPLKKDFPQTIFGHGKNPMEFVQAAGSNPYNAIVLMDPHLSKDLVAVHHYLRSKSQFYSTPILALIPETIQVHTPLADPLLRVFNSSSGVFLPMMEFFEFAANPAKAPHEIFAMETLVNVLSSQLSFQLPDNPQLELHEAADDDLHSEFATQLGCEVATSLLWIKTSVRILTEGSSGLMSKMGSGSESEITNRLETLLEKSMTAFQTNIHATLVAQGSIPFANPDDFQSSVKLPFLKKAKSQGFVLECADTKILAEMTRYI